MYAAGRTPATTLERRFAEDVNRLYKRASDTIVEILIRIGDEFGIRASVEEIVFRHARRGRAPRLIWSRPAPIP